MQDLGGHLIIGKYYQLETHDKAQDIGKTDDGQCFLFEWTNPSKKKNCIKANILYANRTKYANIFV